MSSSNFSQTSKGNVKEFQVIKVVRIGVTRELSFCTVGVSQLFVKTLRL